MHIIIYLKSDSLAFVWGVNAIHLRALGLNKLNLCIHVSCMLNFSHLSSKALITRNYTTLWIKVRQNHNCMSRIEFSLNSVEIILGLTWLTCTLHQIFKSLKKLWFLNYFITKETKVLKFTSLLHIIKLNMINLFPMTYFKKIDKCLIFGTYMDLK